MPHNFAVIYYVTLKLFIFLGINAGLNSVSLGLSVFKWRYKKTIPVRGLTVRQRWVVGHVWTISCIKDMLAFICVSIIVCYIYDLTSTYSHKSHVYLIVLSYVRLGRINITYSHRIHFHYWFHIGSAMMQLETCHVVYTQVWHNICMSTVCAWLTQSHAACVKTPGCRGKSTLKQKNVYANASATRRITKYRV
jgi:hypothetical protein